MVNVVRQLNEWGGLCGSEERVLRDFGRGSVGDGKDGTSLMNGRLILPEGGNEDIAADTPRVAGPSDECGIPPARLRTIFEKEGEGAG